MSYTIDKDVPIPPPPNDYHGMEGTPMYEKWKAMKSRCLYPSDKSYQWYGARGIKVCERWRRSFKAFYDDVGDPPSPEHSLDRIDNDGPYAPENVRWATIQEQNGNRRLPKKHKNNTSGMSGVHWDRTKQCWRAEYRKKRLGSFRDKFEAFCARKSAEAAYNRANLNP